MSKTASAIKSWKFNYFLSTNLIQFIYIFIQFCTRDYLIKSIDELFSGEDVNRDQVGCDAENSKANLCNVGNIISEKRPKKTPSKSFGLLLSN